MLFYKTSFCGYTFEFQLACLNSLFLLKGNVISLIGKFNNFNCYLSNFYLEILQNILRNLEWLILDGDEFKLSSKFLFKKPKLEYYNLAFRNM